MSGLFSPYCDSCSRAIRESFGGLCKDCHNKRQIVNEIREFLHRHPTEDCIAIVPRSTISLLEKIADALEFSK